MSHESTPGTPVNAFGRFVAAINEHDADALGALMHPDHLFVDSLGNRVQGATPMKSGWSGYFAMCPDYWIRIDLWLAEDDTVLAVGQAGGSIDHVVWQTPAAWRAVIRDGLVWQWQVFADNKPVYDILAKRKRPHASG